MPKIDVTEYVNNILNNYNTQSEPQSATQATIGYDRTGKPVYDPIGIKSLENTMDVNKQRALIPGQVEQKVAEANAMMPLDIQKDAQMKQADALIKEKFNYQDSLGNLNKALGMFQNQAAAYREGIDAGVAGNRANYIKGNFESWLGGEVGDKASPVGRIQSASRDTMFMMAPVLMQSKRFMASVQSALMKTMPQDREGGKTARDKLQQDAWNLYRLTRTDAYKQLTPQVMVELDKSQKLADHVAKELIAESMKYQPDADEIKQVNGLLRSATAPLNDIGKDKRSILERDYPDVFKESPTWNEAKEARYQELLKKYGGQ